MDHNERATTIGDKAIANAQRRNRDRLLQSLNPLLSQALGLAPKYYIPESQNLISAFWPASAHGIGEAKMKPTGYRYFEITSAEQAFELITGIDDFPDRTDCYLLIAPPSQPHRADSFVWSWKYPLFVVDALLAKIAVPHLWPTAENFLAIVGCTLDFGMIIDHRVQEPDNYFASSPIVYEVALWRSSG